MLVTSIAEPSWPAQYYPKHDLSPRLIALFERFEPTRIDAAWASTRTPLLRRLRHEVAQRAEGLAATLSMETNRPITACQLEVTRALQTIEKTAEALAVLSVSQAHDWSDAVQGPGHGFSTRFTFGPLWAIVPFNFPLNLALHKIAPALALGLPFVCKAPLQTPHTYRLLHDAFLDAGVPDDDFAFVTVPNDEIVGLIEDTRAPLLSFTGSFAVGNALRRRFPDRTVILELGSTTAAVFLAEAVSPLYETFLPQLARSAFGSGGQSCISLQHLVVPQSAFTRAVNQLKENATHIAASWEPSAAETICSPLIDGRAFAKVEGLLADARASGWEVWQPRSPLKERHYMPPTLVLPCPPKESGHGGEGLRSQRLSQESRHRQPRLLVEEAFGPVLCLHALAEATPEGAARFVNPLDSNIHVSLFTEDTEVAERFFCRTLSRSVLWNRIPSWRADAMPYGGFTRLSHASSWHTGLLGDEGPLQTLKSYTVDRLFVLP